MLPFPFHMSLPARRSLATFAVTWIGAADSVPQRAGFLIVTMQAGGGVSILAYNSLGPL
jgi:hypothetical protein